MATRDLTEHREEGTEDRKEARTTKTCRSPPPTKRHLQYPRLTQQLAVEEPTEVTINIYKTPLSLTFTILRLQGMTLGRPSTPGKRPMASRKDSRLQPTLTIFQHSDESSASTSTRKASNQSASTSTTAKPHHTNGFGSTPRQSM